jgi:hypothetical protein
MKGLFVDSQLFGKHRQTYLTDGEYLAFQIELLLNPKFGDVIQGTGGL